MKLDNENRVKSDKKVSPPLTEPDEESSFALREDKPDSGHGGGFASPTAKQTDKGEEKKVSERERKEYFENIVIHPEDVGKTLFKVIEQAETSADYVTDLSPTEEEYLNQLIFKGFVSHKIFLKENFPVTFRSVPAVAAQRGFDLLAKERGIDAKLANAQTCMILATYLESYNEETSDGLVFSHKSMSQSEFIKEESIQERYIFCLEELGSIIVDTLGARLSEFLSVLKRISLAKNIINF